MYFCYYLSIFNFLTLCPHLQKEKWTNLIIILLGGIYSFFNSNELVCSPLIFLCLLVCNVPNIVKYSQSVLQKSSHFYTLIDEFWTNRCEMKYDILEVTLMFVVISQISNSQQLLRVHNYVKTSTSTTKHTSGTSKFVRIHSFITWVSKHFLTTNQLLIILHT